MHSPARSHLHHVRYVASSQLRWADGGRRSGPPRAIRGQQFLCLFLLDIKDMQGPPYARSGALHADHSQLEGSQVVPGADGDNPSSSPGALDGVPRLCRLLLLDGETRCFTYDRGGQTCQTSLN